MEEKRHNRWNRETGVKKRYTNFIRLIKGKLEMTTPKRRLSSKVSLRNMDSIIHMHIARSSRLF
jgi:hypothetical protein